MEVTIVCPYETTDRYRSGALVGRADVADIRDRMGPFSYTVGSQALKRHGNSDIEDKRILAYAAT